MDTSQRSGFERERLRYCEAMYSLEKERKQIIEKYAQFYFGAITLFLSVLSLKSEFIETLTKALARSGSHAATVVIHCCLGIFLASVTGSLLSILMVFVLQRRAKPYPPGLVTRLFWKEEQQGRMVADLSESDLLEQNAMRFAIAAEQNSRHNTTMSKWLLAAATASFMTVLSYLLLAAITITYLL